jgi:two-component system KDP operon response regulator KdpE
MVILDLSLNGNDKEGLAVCRELRSWSEVPILVLSVQDKPDDKVQALDLGADDYLTKPFETSELLARIRSHLRRSTKYPVTQPVLEMGELRLDWARRQVFHQGREVRLTRLEYNILSYLATNAGRVVTYSMLLNQVWGPAGGDLQTLRVHVVNLRRKIEPDLNRPRYLLTEAGVGYRFAAS